MSSEETSVETVELTTEGEHEVAPGVVLKLAGVKQHSQSGGKPKPVVRLEVHHECARSATKKKRTKKA